MMIKQLLLTILRPLLHNNQVLHDITHHESAAATISQVIKGTIRSCWVCVGWGLSSHFPSARPSQHNLLIHPPPSPSARRRNAVPHADITAGAPQVSPHLHRAECHKNTRLCFRSRVTCSHADRCAGK